MSDDAQKHLEFIQNIITRLNQNSFQLKEWAITLIVGILAVYAATTIRFLFIIGLLISIIFWILDTYYLFLERRYRGLYNDVAGLSNSSVKIKLFDLSIDCYKGGKYSYFRVMFSKTQFVLYIALISMFAAAYIFIR